MGYNKIKLNGKQICDYIYIQNKAPENDRFHYVNDEPIGWDASTVLYANFNDKDRPLNAGNSSITGSIEGYEVYRRKYNESFAKYIGTVQKVDAQIQDMMIDYAAKNGVEYVYYFYPNTDKTQSNAVLSPFITKQLSLDCDYWSLFIVDESQEENVFYLDKMFKFELNLEVGDMTNNAQITITPNFTKYPTVQYGNSNYWSGSLSALCGFVSSTGVDYVQTTNMIEELKSLSSDTRRKFLKDTNGNLWEVDVAAPINISTENVTLQAINTWQFSWVEVGDANDISIINNPSKTTTDWILTESGQAIPYFTYVWGDQYVWDNSYLWTAHNDNNSVENTNLGRKITK